MYAANQDPQFDPIKRLRQIGAKEAVIRQPETRVMDAVRIIPGLVCSDKMAQPHRISCETYRMAKSSVQFQAGESCANFPCRTPFKADCS